MLSITQTVSGLRVGTRQGPYLVDQTTLGALQGRALREGGACYSPWDDDAPRTFWPIAGKGRDRCIQPVTVVLNSGENEATPMGSAIELHVRCRRCEPCLKAKSAYWKMRAMVETVQSVRTWFVTLTWREEDRLLAEYAVSRQMRDDGIEAPSLRELFPARVKVMSPVVNRWLQRIRKGRKKPPKWWDPREKWVPWAPARFRYLLVWEEHNGDETSDIWRGFPHAHLLIHEQRGHVLSKRRIGGEWPAGFEKTRLVESYDPQSIHRDCAYTCKYIAKSMLSRVRASISYGHQERPFEP